MNGIGGHTKQGEGLNTTWLTPPEILWTLGKFDLDPCAAPEPRPWATAERHITLPGDGLAEEWGGRVWLNPPYSSEISKWMQKMAAHRTGVALTFARTETEWWRDHVWPAAIALLFIYGRLNFHFPHGARSPFNAGGPSVLIAYSTYDADRLWTSGISGAFVEVKKYRSVGGQA